MKSDLPKSLWRRVMNIFSWITGISFSALILGIFGFLLALAIFVRTDFFKNRLRDEVLTLARETLNSEITFEGADVAIFSPEPKIEITGVRFFNRDSKVEIKAEKVGVSISPILTVPLLLFNQLHLSAVTLEGVQYPLTSTRPITRLVDRFRPKDSFVPSAFQTIIRRFVFRRIQIDSKLMNDPLIPVPISGAVFLERFEIAPGRTETSFSADLSLSNFRVHEFENLNGTLSVSKGSLKDERLQFNRLEFKNEEDFIVLSGRIGKLSEPDLDVEGRARLELSKYLQNAKIEGVLGIEARAVGLLNNLEARGSLQSKRVNVRGLELQDLAGEVHLEREILKIESLKWRDSSGGQFSIKGGVPLKSESGSVTVSLNQVSIGAYLSPLSKSLKNWVGRVDGSVALEGNLTQGATQFKTDLKISELEIRTESSGRLIHSVSELNLEASGTSRDWQSGDTSFSIKNDLSTWKGTAVWSRDQGLELNWRTEFTSGAKPYGRFFYYELGLQGAWEGRFTTSGDEGPQMRLEPKGLRMQLDDLTISNLTGAMIYENDLLLADPLLADGLELRGGIEFTKRGQDDEFSNLRFRVRNKSLASLFGIFRLKDNWNRDLDGDSDFEGRLNGVLFKPSGTGRLVVRDWTYKDTSVKGRLAQTDWVADRGNFDLLNLRVFTSRDSRPFMGEIELSEDGLEEARLIGKGVRLGEWFDLFGVQNFQSLGDSEIDYSRSRRFLKVDLVARESSVGGTAQENSKLSLNWLGDRVVTSVQLFGERIVVDLNSQVQGRALRTDYRANAQDYDTATLLPWTGARVSFNVSGSGTGSFEQSISGLENFVPLALLEPMVRHAARWKMQNANLRKGSIPLLQVKPFEVTRSEQGRTTWTRIEFVSDQHVATVSGYFSNLKDYRADIEGSFDLRGLSALISELSRSDGRCDVRGSLDPSGFTGLIQVQNGILNLQGTPFTLRNVAATLRSSSSNFRVENFRGEFRDGDFDAEGSFRLRGVNLESMLVQARLSQSLIQPRSGLSFKLSGPLEFRFAQKKGEVLGRLEVIDGSFRSRLDLRPDFFSGGNRSRGRLVDQAEDPLNAWKLNLGLRTQNPFTIRNNSIDGAVTFQGGLEGTLSHPRIRGRAEILRGQFKYFNRTFDVTSGAIQFRDQNSNIPNYEVRAESEIGEYRVYIIVVGGPPNELKISYSSDPALSERDILSVISSGRASSAVEPLGGFDENTRLTGFTGLSLVTGALQDKIENRLTRDLGIRRFYLVPAFSEETKQTELQLTVGIDLIPNRLQIDYSNFLSLEGGHKVELDFKISRLISVVGSWRDVQNQDQDDFGGDLLFRFEFE